MLCNKSLVFFNNAASRNLTQLESTVTKEFQRISGPQTFSVRKHLLITCVIVAATSVSLNTLCLTAILLLGIVMWCEHTSSAGNALSFCIANILWRNQSGRNQQFLKKKWLVFIMHHYQNLQMCYRSYPVVGGTVS